MIKLNFIKYLKEESPGYFNALADNLGIDFNALKGPNWVADISMRNVQYNGIQYKIDNFVKDDQGNVKGAYLTPINLDQKKVVNGKRVPVTNLNTEKIYVQGNKLQDLLTQGFGQNPQAGGLPV